MTLDASSESAALDLRPIWTEDDYVRFASASEPEIRVWALHRIAMFHPERAPHALAIALRDDSAFVRDVALQIIRDLGLGGAFETALQRSRKQARNAARRSRVAAASASRTARTPRGLSAEDVMARCEGSIADPSFDDESLAAELSRHPRELAAWAPGAMRERGVKRAVAIRALANQPSRWATQALIDASTMLLDSGAIDVPWLPFASLGDPAALAVARREWRKGELYISRVALFLATLAGERHRLPAEMAEEAERARRELLAAIDEGRESVPDEATLALPCTECGRTYFYEFGAAFVHPDSDASERRGWDGVSFTRVIRCKRCGAEDAYALTAGVRQRLMLLAASGGSNRVKLGVVEVDDGKLVGRASEGLRILRERVERDDDAGAWQRLGNFAENCGANDEARTAWSTALARDPNHFEANYALGRHLSEHGDEDRAWPYFVRVLALLPATSNRPGARDKLVARTVERIRVRVANHDERIGLAAEWEDGGVRAGTLVLNGFAHWSALASFLRSAPLKTLAIVSEPRGDARALVRAIVEGSTGSSALGRNDACPCGSGRKYKKCCGA
jgi:tetratricopeptide (TPR) repeat protein